MRTRVWRIAMFALFIFGLGCVGCAKRPTSTPAIPPPTRFVDESTVYAITTTQSLDISAEWLNAHPSHLALVAGHTDAESTQH